MGYLKEQVSYIRGLVDGLDLDETKESRVINAMISLLDDMTDSIQGCESSIDDLNENMESLNDDLSDVEDCVYECEDDDDIDEDFTELECPHCGESVYFDPELVESEADLTCPNCGKTIVVPGTTCEDE